MCTPRTNVCSQDCAYRVSQGTRAIGDTDDQRLLDSPLSGPQISSPKARSFGSYLSLPDPNGLESYYSAHY